MVNTPFYIELTICVWFRTKAFKIYRGFLMFCFSARTNIKQAIEGAEHGWIEK